MHDLRRLGTAVCAGIAVFAALCCILSAVPTKPVVVAARDIRRGDNIAADDLTLTEIPATTMADTLLDSIEAIGSRGIAQIDIVAGQPLSESMIISRPTVPEGFAVFDVRLASAVDTLDIGDDVALASAVGCAAANGTAPGTDETAENSENTDECLIAEHAIIMTISTSDSSPLVSFAMPAADALRVMASQEAGAIVAVAR